MKITKKQLKQIIKEELENEAKKEGAIGQLQALADIIKERL